MPRNAMHKRLKRIDAVPAARKRERRLVSPGPQKLRIAYYSHDTMGLGHLRRNMLIAQSLLRSELDVTNLLITGAHEATLFEMPEGIDCLTLPHWKKKSCGTYEPGKLNIASDRLVSLRSATIGSAVEAFDPDVFIVDKVARGLFGELEPVLEQLKLSGRTRCVLGLRDVLDEPEQVRNEWKRENTFDAIHQWYDSVWIYGDNTVFDAADEYQFSYATKEKVQYTGYLDQSKRRQNNWPTKATLLEQWGLPSGTLTACVVGGGQDGVELADAFVDAVLATKDVVGVLVTGPFMSLENRKRLEQMASRSVNLRVFSFLPEADILLHAADRVVAMGGYNTVCAVLSFSKQALIVPRVTPRLEQHVRAERLETLGLVQMLHPNELSPNAISKWLSSHHNAPPIAHDKINMNGLDRVSSLISELVHV